jgi:hypothetical protein
MEVNKSRKSTPRSTKAFRRTIKPNSLVTMTLESFVIGKHDPCAYRKSHPAILMVQSAQDRAADDIPGPLNAARDRGILVQ